MKIKMKMMMMMMEMNWVRYAVGEVDKFGSTFAVKRMDGYTDLGIPWL